PGQLSIKHANSYRAQLPTAARMVQARGSRRQWQTWLRMSWEAPGPVADSLRESAAPTRGASRPRAPGACLQLGEQFLDGLAVVDELDGPADAAHVFLARVDLQGRVEAGEQVAHRHRTRLDVGAVGAGRPDHLAAADSAARQGDTEGPREVVAAGAR